MAVMTTTTTETAIAIEESRNLLPLLETPMTVTDNEIPLQLSSVKTPQVLYPKECVALYPNPIVGERVSTYAEANSSSIPQSIIAYHAYVTQTQPETAKYMISISQAQMMVFLSKLIGAKRSN